MIPRVMSNGIRKTAMTKTLSRYQIVVRVKKETGLQIKKLADKAQLSKAAWIRSKLLKIIAEELPE